MNMEELRFRFLWYAENMLFRPYRWGGDDPMTGFDCSGMVVECLKAVGLIGLHEDLSADALWHKWDGQPMIAPPDKGMLAFWSNDKGQMTHVAICLDDTFCLTADGGGSTTTSLEAAESQNAFIKMRLIDHRKSKPMFRDPFLGQK